MGCDERDGVEYWGRRWNDMVGCKSGSGHRSQTKVRVVSLPEPRDHPQKKRDSKGGALTFTFAEEGKIEGVKVIENFQ